MFSVPGVDQLCLLVPLFAVLILNEAQRVKAVVAWERAV